MGVMTASESAHRGLGVTAGLDAGLARELAAHCDGGPGSCLMRASDPIFELGLAMGGHKQEDRFWQQTLTALARHFEHDAEVDTVVVCVDKRCQWSRWRNVRHSSAIRSTLYT